MSYQDLIYEVNSGVATITLNRPNRMNAISPNLEIEIHRAFGEADDDKAVRAIILTGSGKAFALASTKQPRSQAKRPSTPRASRSPNFSDIHDSCLVGNSPWLIAASHVLLRLQAPRHPPLTLCNLENIDARARYGILKVRTVSPPGSSRSRARGDERPADEKSHRRREGTLLVIPQKAVPQSFPQNGIVTPADPCPFASSAAGHPKTCGR